MRLKLIALLYIHPLTLSKRRTIRQQSSAMNSGEFVVSFQEYLMFSTVLTRDQEVEERPTNQTMEKIEVLMW